VFNHSKLISAADFENYPFERNTSISQKSLVFIWVPVENLLIGHVCILCTRRGLRQHALAISASRPKLLAMHAFVPSTIRRYPGQVWLWSKEHDVGELPAHNLKASGFAGGWLIFPWPQLIMLNNPGTKSPTHR
jgi:hypothetical protein